MNFFPVFEPPYYETPKKAIKKSRGGGGGRGIKTKNTNEVSNHLFLTAVNTRRFCQKKNGPLNPPWAVQGRRKKQ
jgi:hypothetical protein